MSTQAETFYAIRCDFPDCGVIYDSDDYTYMYDAYANADSARDAGWLAGGPLDFCGLHTVEVECPAELMVDDGDGVDVYCQWCEDNGTDVHRAPMEDTLHNRIASKLRHVIERELWRFDSLINRLERERQSDLRLIRRTGESPR